MVRWNVALSVVALLLCSGGCVTVPPQAAGLAPAREHAPLPADLFQHFFDRYAADGFNGAVLIDQGGRTIFQQTYGLADDSRRLPITRQTIFDIGSLAKQFTAAAILKLESEGKLGLDDTVGKYFPNAPADKAGITIRQLLSHTSGLRSLHADNDRERLTREQAVERILAQQLRFAPGSGWAYSNSAFTLAAAIVEIVAERPYFDVVDDLIRRAGLRRTAYYSDGRFDRLPVAHGYVDGRDLGSPADWPGPTWATIGNGEYLSTADELRRWLRHFAAGEIVAPALVRRMWTPVAQVPGGVGIHYGLGWTIRETRLGRRLTHNGGGDGGNAIWTFYPELDLVVIVLSNRFWNVRIGREEFDAPATAAVDKLEELLVARLTPAAPGAEATR
jgi:CubicO group peptidase (beta-lactamase class C family)